MKKVLVVTGSRKGIGKHLAEYYLAKGFVVVGCSRKPGTITHADYSHYELDVCDEKKVSEMLGEVAKKFGRIDVLLNNAGIASMNHLVLTPLAVTEKIFGTNFFGSFLFTREAAKVMIRQKSGRIVNFSTVAVPLRLEGEAVYAASKAAVEAFTRISARELASFNITVNAIGPTPIATDLVKNIPKEKMDALVQRQAVRRLGEFRDVYNAIDFFIQPESDFVTGQILYLGGV